MNKTLIEWVKNPDGTQGYTINPVKGLCPMACSYCYARAMYKRFKWNPEIRFDLTIEIPKKPSRIFVGSTMELFGDWIQPNWMKLIFNACRDFPQHTYIFLTKQPQNLIKFSPFSGNCWVGVTATNSDMCFDALAYLAQIHATVKYISFEPLLSPVYDISLVKGSILRELGTGLKEAGVHWVIIGAMTGSLEDIKKMLMEYPQLTPMPYGKKWTLQPKIEWVEEIVKAADKAGIPVFLKNNLKPMFGVMTSTEAIKYGNLNESHLIEEITFNGDNKIIAHKLRQEMPK